MVADGRAGGNFVATAVGRVAGVRGDSWRVRAAPCYACVPAGIAGLGQSP
jgi:hypothetical protein